MENTVNNEIEQLTKKDRKTTFYKTDKRGPLSYVDIIRLNKEKKILELINDYEPDRNFGLDETKVPAWKFESLLKKYKNMGYEMKEIDGAGERLSTQECLDALSLKFPYEKLSLYTHERVTPSHYYDLNLIRKATDLYIDESLGIAYIRLWSTFYARSIFESFDIFDEAEKKYMLVIGTALWDFGLEVTSNEDVPHKRKTCNSLLNTLQNAQKLKEKKEMKNA